MFDAKTVFILGAGASWHYGYPIWEDLVRRVKNKASPGHRLQSLYERDGRNPDRGLFLAADDRNHCWDCPVSPTASGSAPALRSLRLLAVPRVALNAVAENGVAGLVGV